MGAIRDRLAHAWNAFRSPETTGRTRIGSYGSSYSGRPDRARFTIGNERTIIASIYTRISIDVADAILKHVRLDDQDRYSDDIKSELNRCLTIEANLDQGARHFRQDIAQTLFDRGVAAVVPIDLTVNPLSGGGFDIRSMRVGWVTDWQPDKVLVNVYDERDGERKDLLMPKRMVALIENPLYAVMNEPNSTLQRLNRKLALLDSVDEQMSSGKLDIIIQLPYSVKTDSRKKLAEQRRDELEFQLAGSKYGIGYMDGTEKITQLNRPAENNLLKQVGELKEQLYAELGTTIDVMNGTADEAAMLNYNNRTVRPILDAIVEAMTRSFLTRTAQTQRQRIVYFRDPFKLVPLGQIAEIADKLTRAEVASSNEIRGWVGLRPVKDPKADELRNSNMPESELGRKAPPNPDSKNVEDEPEDSAA